MGGEFAQEREWNHDGSLDWHLLDDPMHRGVQALVRDLNHLYRELPALHQLDCEAGGLRVARAARQRAERARLPAHAARIRTAIVVVLCNFTPVLRQNYRVGVPLRRLLPRAAQHRRASSTAAAISATMAASSAEEFASHGRPLSLRPDIAAAGDRRFSNASPTEADPIMAANRMTVWPGQPAPARRDLGRQRRELRPVLGACDQGRAVPVRPRGTPRDRARRAAGVHRRGLARLPAAGLSRHALRLSRAWPLRPRPPATASTPTSC